ncbi:hypothetical protein Scep_014870 [Stephania cephalantha]|uniref:Uncharacterized protein n=1 Tax=Stephania cephalantha TaxID=152367 RepID=A0AAP0P0W3_9MAGN
MASSAARGYAEAADELQQWQGSGGGDGRHLRCGGGEKQGRRREAAAMPAVARQRRLQQRRRRAAEARLRRRRDSCSGAVRQRRGSGGGAASAATRWNGVEKRRGGALPDRLIPDEVQQQWSRRRDFDEARRRDGLLANETRGVGHGT